MEMAQRIAHSLSGSDYKDIIEVGPGKGMLSQFLMESDYNALYVETDIDMVEYLKRYYTESSDQIIHQDFLKMNLENTFAGRPFAVIGNYPYNISSQIIFKCLEHTDRVKEIIGMFQLEVAKRIIAPEGGKEYGIISVITQLYYTGEKLFVLKPGSFEPPPKVMSAVIRLRRRERDLSGLDEKLFRRVVKTTFGQRRKMLRKTLRAIIPDGIDPEDKFFQQRPEQLSVEDFITLTKFVKRQLAKS